MLKIICLLAFLITNTTFAKVKRVPGVDWHKGTVESAFAMAKKRNMSIFLYWGATWCPPCNQIKKTIFTKKEFQKEMNYFIPVYLDGDEKRAQTWGEKLGAKGYPTMIVLNSQGKEVTRMPSGLKIKGYVNLLQKARRQEHTIQTLVTLFKKGKLTNSQWNILANYSWEQDFHLQESFLSKDNKLNNYTSLFNKAPEKYKPAFFFRVATTPEQDLNKKKLYKNYLLKILKNENLVSQNIESLAYSASSIAKNLQKDKKDHKVQIAIITAMNRYRKNKSLKPDELLITYIPRLTFFELDQGEKYKVSQDFQNTLLKSVRNIEVNVKDKYARHSALTTSVWMLMSANMIKEAKSLALREIKTSPHAYYYMSYLTSIELKLKKTNEALKWSKKGWKLSKGPATRFQWGYSYLSNLLKHKTKDSKKIRKTYNMIMAEYKKYDLPDAGRNKRIRAKLKKKMEAWNKKNPKKKITL
jgi:thioredoxin-related protein